MSKNLISVVLAFGIGFVSSRLVSNSSVEEVKNPSTLQCPDLAAAKTSLISISQNEYMEYKNIKDLKQKYEKADEILGKVMLLFLADVGFRLQKDVVAEPAASAEVSAPQQSAVVENTSPLPYPSSPTTQNDSGLKGKSSLIKNLRSEKQILDALQKSVIENPKVETAKGGSPTQKQMRILEGRYAGRVRFLDGKRGDLAVTWDLMPDYTKGELSGTYKLGIHGPGKDSETHSNGSISNIVSLSEDQDGFLVNACGEECYLQLYYNVPSDQFFGSYYEMKKGSKNQFDRLGIVDLKK